MATIWEDLKAAIWTGGPYALPNPQRALLNFVASAIGTKIVDNPQADSTDITLQESAPIYVFESAYAPATTTDNFCAPFGLSAQRIERAVARRMVISSLAFVCRGTALATDSVTCTLERRSSLGFITTSLQIIIPAGTAPGTVIMTQNTPVEYLAGEALSLKVKQSGATVQANWLAAWTIG
jgi:hypothetical protein